MTTEGHAKGAEQLFLEYLFEALALHEIQYAVMRNGENLPVSANGSDLDLLILPSDRDTARSAISEAIAKAGGASIGWAETVGFFKVYAFGEARAGDGDWWGLRIDVNVGLSFKGIPLLDGQIPFPVVDQSGVLLLREDLAAIFGVLKEILFNGDVSARYLPGAQQCAAQNWHEISRFISPMGESAISIFRSLIDRSSNDSLPNIQRNLISALRKQALSSSSLRWLSRRLRFEWSKIRRFRRPPGIVLAVLGVDGSGKTTVIERVLPVLDAATHGAIVIKHLRPGLLPALSRLRGEPVHDGVPVTKPHGSTPSGSIVSLLRVFYLLSDYVLGYWLIVRPTVSRGPSIVLFDRYAYDMALDPGRFRIQLNARLLRFLVRFAPKPDIIFCLHGDPGVIFERKKELPLEEVQRQVMALRDYSRSESRSVLISTECDEDTAKDEVLHALRDACARRDAASASR